MIGGGGTLSARMALAVARGGGINVNLLVAEAGSFGPGQRAASLWLIGPPCGEADPSVKKAPRREEKSGEGGSVSLLNKEIN